MVNDVARQIRMLNERVAELERRLDEQANAPRDTAVEDFEIGVERLAFRFLLLRLELLLPQFVANDIRDDLRNTTLKSLDGMDLKMPEAKPISDVLRVRFEEVIKDMFSPESPGGPPHEA